MRRCFWRSFGDLHSFSIHDPVTTKQSHEHPSAPSSIVTTHTYSTSYRTSDFQKRALRSGPLTVIFESCFCVTPIRSEGRSPHKIEHKQKKSVDTTICTAIGSSSGTFSLTKATLHHETKSVDIFHNSTVAVFCESASDLQGSDSCSRGSRRRLATAHDAARKDWSNDNGYGEYTRECS